MIKDSFRRQPSKKAEAPDRSLPSDPEHLIDRQLEAYNAHDLEAFMSFYAAEARLYDPPDGPPLAGWAAIRERYRRRFSESPDVRVEILNRMVLGRFVIDHERLIGWEGGETRSAVVAYETGDGAIRNVWVMR